jgi:hypothetical protein
MASHQAIAHSSLQGVVPASGFTAPALEGELSSSEFGTLTASPAFLDSVAFVCCISRTPIDSALYHNVANIHLIWIQLTNIGLCDGITLVPFSAFLIFIHPFDCTVTSSALTLFNINTEYGLIVSTVASSIFNFSHLSATHLCTIAGMLSSLILYQSQMTPLRTLIQV